MAYYAPAQPVVKDVPLQDGVRSLIMQQQFSGNWTLQSLPPLVKQLSLELLQKSKPSSLSAAAEGDNIWATALAIAVFAVLYSQFKTYWEMVVTKANKWLSKTLKKLNMDGAALQEEATKVVKENAQLQV